MLFWLAVCDPYQSLQVTSKLTDLDHFFLPIYSLYLSTDAFESLREATISFVVCVCPTVRPSVRMEELGSNRANFHKILYLKTSRKSVDKFKYDRILRRKRVICMKVCLYL
jgi:hypothetical protein